MIYRYVIVFMDIKKEIQRFCNIDILKDLFLIVVGSFIMAIAYSAFLAPNNIVPGGVYGLSIVINHWAKSLFGEYTNEFQIGRIALLFNIPLFILSARSLGKETAIKTVISFLLIAFFTDLVSDFLGGKALVEGDVILSSFYGGVILGFSVFLVFKAGSTAAGTDTLSRVIAKKYNIKLSTVIIVIDSAIVMLGLIAFGDFRVPLYSWISIFIYGKVIEVLQPQNPYKSVFIISDKSEEIREAIIHKMGIRGTFIKGEGMYEGKERKIIYIIVQRKNLLALKKEVLSIDEKAFISSSDASQDTNPQLI